jgi:hypothetical protein
MIKLNYYQKNEKIMGTKSTKTYSKSDKKIKAVNQAFIKEAIIRVDFNVT